MLLRVYLAEINMSVKDFSQALGCHPNYLSRIIHEKILPSRRLAKDIERITQGMVKVNYNTKKKTAPVEDTSKSIYNSFEG